MVREKWKRFTRLFRPRLDTLVGVDFSHGTVKVAEVSLAGTKPYLRAFAIADTGNGLSGDEDIAAAQDTDLAMDTQALTELLRRTLSLGGVKAKDAVLAVGGQLSFVREVTFPRLPADELAEAIRWDIPKYVPYEADSYEYDYAITGHDVNSGEMKVLIVAAPRQVVRQLTQVARQAGLRPVAVDIEPVAVIRTISGADNSMVVDVGAASTQISLFQHSNPVFTRIVPVGGDRYASALNKAAGDQADTELDEVVEEIAKEIRRTSHFLAMQNKQVTIEKVFVTGFTELDSLVRSLRTKTELTVIGHNPLADIEINPSISASQARKIGPQLAVAVGLAMRGDEL